MKKRYVVGLITLILFIIVTVLVVTKKISWFDDAIYNLVKPLRDNNIIKIFFTTVTRLGDLISSMIIILILLVFLKKKNKILLASNVTTSLASNQILKHIFKRKRPPVVEHLVKQGGFSYPSGHTMMATCIYGILIYMVIKDIKNKKLKITLIIILSLLIISIGLSRIYVRVHWPSDVLGGYLLTITTLITTTEIINHFLGGKENEKNVCK